MLELDYSGESDFLSYKYFHRINDYACMTEKEKETERK